MSRWKKMRRLLGFNLFAQNEEESKAKKKKPNKRKPLRRARAIRKVGGVIKHRCFDEYDELVFISDDGCSQYDGNISYCSSCRLRPEIEKAKRGIS